MWPFRVPRFAVLIGMGLLSVWAYSQEHPSEPMGPPPEPDMSRVQQEMEMRSTVQPLHITFGKKSADWTRDKIGHLPQTTITVVNSDTGATDTYSGVPVLTLLEPLGFPVKPREKDFRMYLLVRGAEGTEVVYAMAEVIPTVHDATVIVADALNGKPLGSSGPLQLVASGEKQPFRWVKNLVSIRVEIAH